MDDTLRQDQTGSETSRRLSGREGARQDPDAPKIDGYTLTAKLGAGAYGEVWKAWQKRTGKWVAVKVFPRRHGVDWLLLQREVERLIKLDKHPHVVSLLDADLTGDPPYFAMEFMEGGALTRFVDPANPATPEQAARWAEQIAEALCYVHSKGILHCDLKPANVLLDDQGRVRVADFGQSRIASESTGALGTLYFMAPEQALTFKQNEQLCPDVRWDLFGLGATMYAVLTGRPPHEEALRPELEKADGLDGRLEAYRNGIRKMPVPQVRADEDLAAIVQGLLEPWPERRYANSGALRADLASRLESRPVSRLAGSTLYRLRKFARRNSAAALLGALLALAIGVGTAAVFRQNAALGVELANAYALRARSASDKGDNAAAAVLFARSNALHPTGLARRSALSHLQALERPLQVWNLGSPVQAVGLNKDGSRIVAGGDDFDAAVLDAKSGAVLTKAESENPYMLRLAMIGGGDHERPAEFSRDGSKALAFSRGAITVLDAATGKKLQEISGVLARFTADGKVLVAGAGEGPPRVRVVDPATSAAAGPVFKHPSIKQSWVVPSFDLSPDGKTVLTCAGEMIQLFDAATGKPQGPPLPYSLTALKSMVSLMIGPMEDARFSPTDGRSILSTTIFRAALLDRSTGKIIGKPMRHDDHITVAAYTPHGEYVLTGGDDGTLRKWHASRSGDDEPGTPIGGPLRHGGAVAALAVSPDGHYAATAGLDGVARIWAVVPWAPWGREMLHGSPILSVAFSGDGKFLVTGGRDGTVRLWKVPEQEAIGRTLTKISVFRVQMSRDGTRLVGEGDGADLYEMPSGRVLGEKLAKGPMGVSEVEFSLDGSRLVTVVRGAVEAVVFDRDGKKLRTVSHADAPKKEYDRGNPELSLARLDRSGKRLLTYSLEVGLRVWDVDTGKKLAELPTSGYVYDAQFSPDGARIAISTGSTEVRDALLAKNLTSIPDGAGLLAWSPDGTRLGTTHGEKLRVRLWDAGTGAALGPGVDHEAAISSLFFTPDGAALVSASEDGTSRLIDAQSGRLIGGPMAHGGPVRTAAASRDGSTIATGGKDGVIRFWDVRSGEPVARTIKADGLVDGLWFSGDGKTLHVAASSALELWDVGWLSGAATPGRLTAAAESLAQRTVGQSGSVTPLPLKDWDRNVPLP